MGTSGALRPSSVPGALALSLWWLAGLAAWDGAAAQDVINPNFSLPAVAFDGAECPQASQGLCEDPATTPQIGWTFSKVGATTSGVRANSSAFTNAPAAPNGQPQTAYIDNVNSISQNIAFKRPGDYELTFQIAGYAHNTLSGFSQRSIEESVMVQIGTQQYGPFTPNSSSSFNQPTPIHFNVATANSSVALTFVGTGPNTTQLAQGEYGVVFIADVAIKPIAPQITCPQNLDIDPTSTVTLNGTNFGSVPGQVQIYFPQPSQVAFKNSSFPNSTHKSKLLLKGSWSDTTITTEALDSASDIGAAPAQTVEITVIAANGQSSNVCKANFHDKPVIMGLTSGSFTPGQSFNIWGWDFGNDPGKVTIHWTNNLFNPHDYEITDANWKAWAVNARIEPDLAGVVEQDVDISLTPKGGTASNAKTKKFKPTILIVQAPMSVLQCGNETTLDLCNPPPGETYSVCLSFAGVPLTLEVISIEAYHLSCSDIASDNGQDIYAAILLPPWTITEVDNEDVPPLSPGVWVSAVNTSMQYTVTTLPANSVVVTVNWHIGPSGGMAFYAFTVLMKGPAGVPFQPPQ